MKIGKGGQSTFITKKPITEWVDTTVIHYKFSRNSEAAQTAQSIFHFMSLFVAITFK